MLAYKKTEDADSDASLFRSWMYDMVSQRSNMTVLPDFLPIPAPAVESRLGALHDATH